MKRVITLVFALILSITCFAQSGFSNVFPAEPTSHSNTCSNIRTSFAIICDQDDYWCVVHMYGKYDYYTVSYKAYPRLYMKTNKGDTVELRSLESGDEAVLKNYIDKQYISTFYFPIPDINKFASNYYIEYSIWLGDYTRNVNLDSGGFMQEFNDNMKNAVKMAKAERNTICK